MRCGSGSRMQQPPKLKPLIAGLGLAASIMFYFTPTQEGVEYISYPDSGNVYTIGLGHTHGVYKGMRATKSQVCEWYREDVSDDEKAYNRLVKTPQHPNVKAAAMDFIFNAGAGNFAGSSLRKLLNAGNRAGACREFPKWRKAAGKDCREKKNNCAGVIVRREKEKELCLSNELSVCDYNSGNCQPVSLRATHSLCQTLGG